MKIHNIRREQDICSYTFEEFSELVKSFHGYASPGVIIGGYMVDMAYRILPDGGLYNAISETSKCLPDAVQLLTPCSIGNNRLTVVNLGRYAVTLYDIYTGEGIRVSISSSKICLWPEIESWFFKLKSKKEQNETRLIQEIREAGISICSIIRVKVNDGILTKHHRSGFSVCPCCQEAYPIEDGEMCRGCQGETPYEIVDNAIGQDTIPDF